MYLPTLFRLDVHDIDHDHMQVQMVPIDLDLQVKALGSRKITITIVNTMTFDIDHDFLIEHGGASSIYKYTSMYGATANLQSEVMQRNSLVTLTKVAHNKCLHDHKRRNKQCSDLFLALFPFFRSSYIGQWKDHWELYIQCSSNPLLFHTILQLLMEII